MNVRELSRHNAKNTANLGVEPMSLLFSSSPSRFLPAILWLGLLAWIVRVTVFSRLRQGGDFASVDVYAGLQIAIVFVLFILLLLNRRSYDVMSKILPTSMFLLILYYFVCVLSVGWSVLPQYSLFRSFEFLVLFVATVTAFSCSANLVKAERTYLFINIIVMVLGIYFNLKVHHFQATLSTLHTNSYSASAGMIFTYCFGEYFRAEQDRKKLLRCYMTMSLVGIVLGTSSGSILAVIGGCCLALFFNRSYVAVSLLMCIAIIFLVFDIDLAFVKQLIFYGKSEQSIQTGTGRIPTWIAHFRIFMKKPFLGNGFSVLSTASGKVLLSAPHNSLFSAALGTGLFGISFVVAFIIKLFFELVPTSTKRIPGGVGSAAALATGFVNSLSNPYLFDRWEESSLTFSCMLSFFTVFVLLPYRQKKQHQKMRTTLNRS